MKKPTLVPKVSRFDQHMAIEEGLGLGCLAIGVAAFTSNKRVVDAAFSGAWREWIWVAEFPAMNASSTGCEILHILGRNSTRLAFPQVKWTRGRDCIPSLRDDDEIKDLASDLEERCGVPLEGWIDLANAFVDRLGKAHVRRSE
jgi:hypothetical protein